jgi:hypothetical protein
LHLKGGYLFNFKKETQVSFFVSCDSEFCIRDEKSLPTFRWVLILVISRPYPGHSGYKKSKHCRI